MKTFRQYLHESLNESKSVKDLNDADLFVLNVLSGKELKKHFSEYGTPEEITARIEERLGKDPEFFLINESGPDEKETSTFYGATGELEEMGGHGPVMALAKKPFKASEVSDEVYDKTGYNLDLTNYLGKITGKDVNEIIDHENSEEEYD